MAEAGSTIEVSNRRPMKLREHPWLVNASQSLTRRGVRPNSVSVWSIIVSVIGGALLLLAGRFHGPVGSACLILTIVMIALRGLCNLLDGMIAVEGGRLTRSGGVFNDFPDRVSDVVLFVCAGYAVPNWAWGPTLGWIAAIAALITAYTRLLGGACGATQFFTGPMAKQHRMLVLALGCVAGGIERPVAGSLWSMAAAMAIISVGCVITTAIRLRQIIKELDS